MILDRTRYVPLLASMPEGDSSSAIVRRWASAWGPYDPSIFSILSTVAQRKGSEKISASDRKLRTCSGEGRTLDTGSLDHLEVLETADNLALDPTRAGWNDGSAYELVQR